MRTPLRMQLPGEFNPVNCCLAPTGNSLSGRDLLLPITAFGNLTAATGRPSSQRMLAQSSLQVKRAGRPLVAPVSSYRRNGTIGQRVLIQPIGYHYHHDVLHVPKGPDFDGA
jgi:hypothetical protein